MHRQRLMARTYLLGEEDMLNFRNLAAKVAGFLQDLKFEMIRLVGKMKINNSASKRIINFLI